MLENHMVLNTPDAPWNQPDADELAPEQPAEIDAREKREMAAAEMADGLRQLADFLGEHPDMTLPSGFMFAFCDSRREFLASIRAMQDGGAVAVKADDASGIYPECHAKRSFGPVELDVRVKLDSVSRTVQQPVVELCPEVRELMEGK